VQANLREGLRYYAKRPWMLRLERTSPFVAVAMCGLVSAIRDSRFVIRASSVVFVRVRGRTP
jgi:hypothetical protein